MNGLRVDAGKDSQTSGPKLWVVLARAYGALASFVEHSVAAEGLGLSDFMVLEALLHKGAMTMSTIGEKVLLANASMTSAIDRLDKRGFVVRKNDENDRRIRRVELTEAGRAFISELYRRHELEIEAVVSVLNQVEQDQLRSLLKKLGFSAKDAVAHYRGAREPLRIDQVENPSGKPVNKRGRAE